MDPQKPAPTPVSWVRRKQIEEMVNRVLSHQYCGEIRGLTESEQAVAVVFAFARHCRPCYVQPVSSLLNVLNNPVMWDLYHFLTGPSSDHGRQSAWSSLSQAFQSRYGNKGHASIRDWLVGHVWMNVAYYFNDDGQEFVAKKIYDELKCLQSGDRNYCTYKTHNVNSNGVSDHQTHIFFGSTHVMYSGDHSRLGCGSAGSIRAGVVVHSEDTGSNQMGAEVALKSVELGGGTRLGKFAREKDISPSTYKALLMEWSAHYMPHAHVVRMDDLFLYRKEVKGRSVDKAKLLLPRCHDVGYQNDLTQSRKWYLHEIKGVLQAVKQLHLSGWAHGDIKFGNMLRHTQENGDNRLVLSDFDFMTPLFSPSKSSTFLSPLIQLNDGTAEQLDVFQLALVLAQIVSPQFDIRRFVNNAVKMTPEDYRCFLDHLDLDLLFLKPALSVCSASPYTIDRLIQDFNHWCATQEPAVVQQVLPSTSSGSPTACSNASTVSFPPLWDPDPGTPSPVKSNVGSQVLSPWDPTQVYPPPAPVYPPPAPVYSVPAQVYPPQAPVYHPQAPVYPPPARVYPPPARVYPPQARVYPPQAQVYSVPVQFSGVPAYPPPAQSYGVSLYPQAQICSAPVCSLPLWIR